VPGTLTVATDKPAYPPYFEDDNPANGKGSESAVAYAIATKLGYSKQEALGLRPLGCSEDGLGGSALDD
jgi:polar amino acid transport system substrate-binding protein